MGSPLDSCVSGMGVGFGTVSSTHHLIEEPVRIMEWVAGCGSPTRATFTNSAPRGWDGGWGCGPVAGNRQWGYVPDDRRLVGFVSLPLPLTSLLPLPGALFNITLAHSPFDYTGLRAQWSSHCVVYQLFGQGSHNTHPPTIDPPSPAFKRLGQIFFQAFGQAKVFSHTPIRLDQKFSSTLLAPLKIQHHRGRGWGPGPMHPPQLWSLGIWIWCGVWAGIQRAHLRWHRH